MEHEEFEYNDGTIYDSKHEFPQIMQNDEMYLFAKDDIEKHECITMSYGVESYKFYTPELYHALSFGRFQRYDYDAKCKVNDAIAFNVCYKDAFKRGEQEFNDKISKAGINGTDELLTYMKGWLKKCSPFLQNPEFLTYDLTKEYGRYSGIFSQIIELINTDLRLQQRITDLACDNLELKQRIEKLVKLSPPEKTPLPFDEKLLSDIHNVFNGDIWENISLVDFLNSFSGKAKMIKLKTDDGAIRDFCFLIGQIEKRRKKNSVVNFANWVQSTFDIKQYKTNKKGERPKISNKLNPLLKQYDIK